MTFSVDKKTINIGVPAFVTIALFLMGSSWSAAIFTYKILDKEEYVYRAILKQEHRDSMQIVMNDTLSKSIYFIKQDISSIRKRVESLENTDGRGYRNYTERKVRGVLQYNQVGK